MAAGAKRRLNRALFGAVIIGIFAAVAALLAWSSRPQWRTFMFPADPRTGVAVAVDYPDDWQIGTMLQRPTKFASFMHIQLLPHPPQGMVRWWIEKVLRQEVTYQATDAIEVHLDSGAGYMGLPAIERQARDFFVLPGFSMKLTHERHALGPALAMSGTVTAQFVGKPQGDPPLKGYIMVIALQAKDGLDRAEVSIAAMTSARRFPRFATAVTAMIPRIHLVRTADAVQRR